MFNELHESSINGQPLVFVKSTDIQAYPCGRRRSELININGSTSVDDKIYFPFDPEARLNTEANNRKHSSLNGYTQTYLHDFDSTLNHVNVSLAGYLFSISKDSYGNALNSIEAFGEDLFNYLASKEIEDDMQYLPSADDEGPHRIYANIIIEETPLFSSSSLGKNYNTWVLRNQSDTNLGSTSLDLLNTPAVNSGNSAEASKSDNYYFSGLSFSLYPITGITTEARSVVSIADDNDDDSAPRQYLVSLCILERTKNGDDYEYKVFEQAYLPKVEHGHLENSVKIDTLIVNKIEQSDGTPIPSLKVVEQNGAYQLQFSFGAK